MCAGQPNAFIPNRSAGAATFKFASGLDDDLTHFLSKHSGRLAGRDSPSGILNAGKLLCFQRIDRFPIPRGGFITSAFAKLQSPETVDTPLEVTVPWYHWKRNGRNEQPAIEFSVFNGAAHPRSRG